MGIFDPAIFDPDIFDTGEDAATGLAELDRRLRKRGGSYKITEWHRVKLPRTGRF